MFALCAAVTFCRPRRLASSNAKRTIRSLPLVGDRLHRDAAVFADANAGRLLDERDQLLHLDGPHLELDPRVDVLGVLPDHQQVDVLVDATARPDSAGMGGRSRRDPALAQRDVGAADAGTRGVSIGPFRATPFSRIDESARAGNTSPVRSNARTPISWTSQRTSTPVAMTTRRAASTTSGPIPSPGISVTRWVKTESVLLRVGAAERGADYPGRLAGPRPNGSAGERRIVADKGLREVIAADTQLSDIDGEKGTLSYVGYEIQDLAEHSTFEEVVYLLHHLELPTAPELDGMAASLADERDLHPFQVQLMRTLAEQTSPMSMLRTSVSAASAFDPDGWDESPDAQARKALRLIAKTASLIATYHRLRTGMEMVTPNPALPHAADFLWMLHGTEPDPEDARVLDTTFILYADHTMNASTFTARIVASTLADMFSAITAAIGTLKGPLHGGANEEAMKSFEEVGKPENAEAYVRDRLERHEKIFGFGHAVYKTYDPRAKILKRLSAEACERAGNPKLHEIAEAIEKAVFEQKASMPTSISTPRRLPRARHPDGPDDARVRRGADGGLDRPRARAIRR